MKNYQGYCSCTFTRFVIRLPKPLMSYRVRKCNCDYCSKKRLGYLSDPNGEILLYEEENFKIEYQGSAQAHFYLCRVCEDVVLVTSQFPDGDKGAVNAYLIGELTRDHQFDVITPAKLTPTQKMNRWNRAWSKVTLPQD